MLMKEERVGIWKLNAFKMLCLQILNQVPFQLPVIFAKRLVSVDEHSQFVVTCMKKAAYLQYDL